MAALNANQAQGYMLELEADTTIGLQASRWLRGILERQPRDVRKWGLRVFTHVRVMVTSAASISRILWPNEQRGPGERGLAADEAKDRIAFRTNRGRWLREQLGIEPADFANLRARAVRDSFEHSDERIDQITRDGVTRIVIDYNVFSADHYQPQSAAPIETVRRLDPETLVLYFGPDQIDLAALDTDLATVRRRTVRWMTDNDQGATIVRQPRFDDPPDTGRFVLEQHKPA